jgi:tRNA 2-thiouridine synthesizing protein E
MTDLVLDKELESVEFNDEGYMVDSEEWTPEIAKVLAREEGIPELTDAHWMIIEFCRQRATESGAAPTLRQITGGTDVTTKELFALFPKGPAKKVAKISGLGKPEGCI